MTSARTPAAAPDSGVEQIPVFDIPADSSPPRVSVSNRTRRQRRKHWLVPVVFGGLLLGTLLVYYWEPAVPLEGELDAIVLSDPALAPVTIDASLFEVESEVKEFVLQDLATAPQLLRSPGFLDVQFRGTPDGLQIQVYSSPRTEFIALNLKQDERLWDYVRRHATTLDEPRREELNAALKRFATQWDSARRNNPTGVIRDMLQYRNQIGLNALLGGIGYHVQAVVGSRTYRCIHQQDSRLYFALPRGTDAFVLRGRRIEGRDPVFPGKYLVEVVRKDQPQDEERSSDDSNAVTDTDRRDAS